eukprot:GHVN01099047.1.p1 GENE.GHVN01099047.1~~GHVN01099047.1.p1  ORF type:complete len:110 (+),score=2.34 GHVN01099047.1:120-449(+)
MGKQHRKCRRVTEVINLLLDLFHSRMYLIRRRTVIGHQRQRNLLPDQAAVLAEQKGLTQHRKDGIQKYHPCHVSTPSSIYLIDSHVIPTRSSGSVFSETGLPAAHSPTS